MSKFVIDLNGCDLSQKEISALSSELRKVSLSYLKKLPKGKKFLENSVEFEPNPNAPDWPILVFPPKRFPPFPGFYPIRKDIFKNYIEQFIDTRI